MKFLVSSSAKTHQFKPAHNRTGHLKTCQDCVYFNILKTRLPDTELLRLIYKIIKADQLASSVSSSFSNPIITFPHQTRLNGEEERTGNTSQKPKEENQNPPQLARGTNSFHVTRHVIIIHAKTCFDAHSEKEPTHLVLAFGFSKKLLYSIHSLLEALTLVNLYHFLFVRVIRLQLLHFDPST